MNYPIIVNKSDLNTPIAYLNNIDNDDCILYQTINGENTLKFTAVIEELKTEFLYDENNLILINNDLYKPLILEEEHSENGMLTVFVECEHISYELLDNIFKDFSYSNKDITTVMNNCLMGTDFIFAGTDVTLKTDINYTEECNARQILIAIANNWKAELKFNKYSIYAYKQIGKNRGVDFRFGKNLTGLKRTIDRSKKDENGNPSITYDINIVDLEILNDEYSELEHYELGDTVRIVDSALNIETYKRIISLEKNVLTGKNTSITLGEPLEDLRQTISGIKQKTDSVVSTVNESSPDWDKIKEITDNLGNVIADKLTGTIKLQSANIINSTSTMGIKDNGILFHNQPEEKDSTFACFLNSNGILFANQKNDDGSWKWQTALSWEGLTATKVLASALYGMVMEAVTLIAGNINGGTINGVTMEGSTIYAGDRAKGDYLVITKGGAIYGYKNNVKILNYESANADGRLELYSSNDTNNNLKLDSSFDVTISGTNTGKASRIWTGCNRMLIGGNDAYEIRIELNGKRIMSIEDTQVTINGDLHVTGTTT